MNPYAMIAAESLSVIKENKIAQQANAAALKQAKLESIYEQAKPYLDVLSEQITPEAVRAKIVPTDSRTLYVEPADFPIPKELSEILIKYSVASRPLNPDSYELLESLAREVTPKLARTLAQLREARFDLWVGTETLGLSFSGFNAA